MIIAVLKGRKNLEQNFDKKDKDLKRELEINFIIMLGIIMIK